ncbi:hypothetical protein [Streptomyces sp. NPDC056194]|uniref:hypothetical protein n=1 Tax=Streptomyces sp. NPDC056194 TaxID=3345744 RepID=UPI0035D7A232
MISVLRQGLRLARDFNLDELGWLTDTAFSYIGDTPPRWLDSETATRARWRALVTARRDLLRTTR